MSAAADPGAVALERLSAGLTPSRREVHDLVAAVFDRRGDLDTFGRWLSSMADRDPDAGAIAGVAAAVRERMVAVRHGHPVVADTCGTGGDGAGTFNISTAAALVAAAAGLPVAKHGNRAVSSATGSADVLERLGVRVGCGPAVAARCLDVAGICFCLAPVYHPVMALVGPLRKALGRPTLFNAIGPLCNPAGATVQVVGVGRPELREPLAHAAADLGMERVLVVSGTLPAGNACDEVSVFGPTDVVEIAGGVQHRCRWEPEDFGLSRRGAEDLGSLLVDGPAASAAAITAVLAGVPGPARDTVAVNAGALLWAASRSATLAEGSRIANEAIDSGAAARTLAALVATSREPDPVSPS